MVQRWREELINNHKIRADRFIVLFATTDPERGGNSIDLWAVQAASAQAEAADHLTSVGFTGDDLRLQIAEGADWAEAVASIDWVDGDVLVVGSSSTHRLAQVFLGSSASKIVRHATVPVVIVPGTAIE